MFYDCYNNPVLYWRITNIKEVYFMIELKAPMSIKNEYVLELYDKDGKLKDKAYAYNLVTNHFWECAFGSYTTGPLDYIQIGTGSGTPSVTDTEPFRKLAAYTTTWKSVKYRYPTSTAVYTATFPASTSEVGVITEVGFRRGKSYADSLTTHAMLQDSEGNPITINKTDTDTLIVTATVHATVSFADNVIPPPSAADFAGFGILGAYNSIKENATYYLYCSTLPYAATDGVSVATSPSNYSSSTRTCELKSTRINASTGNNRYFNAIGGYKTGWIVLPDETVFPPYELQPMTVGTGDGVSTEFKCPIPDFVENTEVITVDGVELTRNVDYTVDPIGNSALNATAISAYSSRAVSRSGGYIDSSYSKANYPFGFYAIAKCAAHTGANVPVLNSSDYPIIFDLGADKTCNGIYIDGLVTFTNSFSTPKSCTVHLEYSHNNSDWQEACTIYTQVAGYGYESNLPDEYKKVLTKFEPITARYWRVYASDVSILSYGIGSINGDSFFGYFGDGIKFKTPPADGAEIKIKATVNRPFKTSDYVLDVSATYYF